MLTDKMFSAVSDPVRRDILILLRNGPLSAGQISSHFDVTSAAISYHLRNLREAGLALESRQKNYIFYRVNKEAMAELAAFFASFYEADSGSANR